MKQRRTTNSRVAKYHIARSKIKQKQSKPPRTFQKHLSLESYTDFGKKLGKALLQEATGDLSSRSRKNVKPSNPEVETIKILTDLGVEFEREMPCLNCFFDFYLPKYNTLLEIEG